MPLFLPGLKPIVHEWPGSAVYPGIQSEAISVAFQESLGLQ
jgi:hypothetical protein